MTTAAELRALAEEVECLSGPDRERDAMIWIATESNAQLWDTTRRSSFRTYKVVPPKFTSSIDDAASLVPDGMSWSVRQSGFGCADAEVWNPMGRPQESRLAGVRSPAKNRPAACALVACALRARAALLDEDAA